MRSALLALCLLAASISHSQAKSIANGQNCTSQEQVNLSVSFNLNADGFAQAKSKFDEKMQAVTAFAKQQAIKLAEPQSLNYSVNANSNNGNTNYQLNGNASYLMDNANNAFKLAEFLTQQKFQVSVSVNSYKNGNCANAPVEG